MIAVLCAWLAAQRQGAGREGDLGVARAFGGQARDGRGQNGD